MVTAVCTLFEGDYHCGVASLFNSLIRNGYRGRVFAGYRGARPDWSRPAKPAVVGSLNEAWILEVLDGCEVVLVPLDTDMHFANFKPDFMLSLLDQQPSIDYLFYLDPDICLVRDWQFVEEWASCGVALCEDVNSPVAEHHPRRMGWQRHFAPHGVRLEYRGSEYVNSGCVGAGRQHREFLENWRRLTAYMGEVIGGLGVTKVERGEAFSGKGFASCFDCPDQDALNAAMQMTYSATFSVLPRCAMGFEPGDIVLPHALGRDKPWRRRYLHGGLQGRAPTFADKAFWTYADGPIRQVSKSRLAVKRGTLRAASAMARIYQRS
jgi:hypothetical protein